MFGPTRCGLAFGIAASLWLGASALAAEPPAIEVFTVRNKPIGGGHDLQPRSIAIQVYDIDGLGHLESALSKDLPSAPGAAKSEALRRIGELNDVQMASVTEAADGLAKAVQYGVDRYPAIVIDGTVVIYGLTDVGNAINQYRTWRGAQLR